MALFSVQTSLRVKTKRGMDFETIAKRVSQLAQAELYIGIPEQTAGRLPVPKKLAPFSGPTPVTRVGVTDLASVGGDPTKNNAYIAYLQEFGSPAHNIPPRPFLVPGMRNALTKRKVLVYIRQLVLDALDPGFSGMERSDIMEVQLTKIGILCAEEVRRKITMGPFTPLAPSTVVRRLERRGKSADEVTPADLRPLVDTGRLRQSITYAIRMVGRAMNVGLPTGAGRYQKLNTSFDWGEE